MVKDHLGNEYSSFKEMCKQYNFSPDTVKYRLKKGWSIEKALTEPNARVVTDHKGEIYPSLEEMLKIYGINRNVYYDRMRRGWNKEKTLTEPVKNNGWYDGKIVFHGKQYRSISELCDCYGISYKKVITRLWRGYDLEKALIPRVVHSNWKKSVDHKGNEYPSFNKMCKQYDQCASVVRSRLDNGWSLQEALEKSTNKKIDKKQYFINGKKYDSLKSVCMDYGLNPSVVAGRMKRNNIPIEKALYPAKSIKTAVTDLQGNTYSSYNEMYKAYDINKHIAKARRNNGWNEENILLPPEFSPQRWFQYSCIRAIETLVDNNGIPYFRAECQKCKLRDILTPQQIMEHAKQHD